MFKKLVVVALAVFVVGQAFSFGFVFNAVGKKKLTVGMPNILVQIVVKFLETINLVRLNNN